MESDSEMRCLRSLICTVDSVLTLFFWRIDYFFGGWGGGREEEVGESSAV